MENELPWGWYLARSSGLIGFLLLYLSFFLGLAVRTPALNRIIKPVYSLNVHCWISLQALIFALLHGISLLFDKFVSFNLGNIFIPFYPIDEKTINSGIEPAFLAFGVIAFYLMIVLVATSYLKKHLKFYLWRAIHFLNVGLYAMAVFHSLYLGTDLKTGMLRDIFIYANYFLVFLLLVNLIIRFHSAFKEKTS